MEGNSPPSPLHHPGGAKFALPVVVACLWCLSWLLSLVLVVACLWCLSMRSGIQALHLLPLSFALKDAKKPQNATFCKSSKVFSPYFRRPKRQKSDFLYNLNGWDWVHLCTICHNLQPLSGACLWCISKGIYKLLKRTKKATTIA